MLPIWTLDWRQQGKPLVQTSLEEDNGYGWE